MALAAVAVVMPIVVATDGPEVVQFFAQTEYEAWRKGMLEAVG